MARDEFPDMTEDELILRRLLWRHHGCPSEFLYGDDGEFQCSHPKHRSLNPFDAMDFRRDSVQLIEWKLMNDEGKRIVPRPER
jgi:hypothetical protein